MPIMMENKELENEFHNRLVINEFFEKPMEELVVFKNLHLRLSFGNLWIHDNFEFHDVEIELDGYDDELLDELNHYK